MSAHASVGVRTDSPSDQYVSPMVTKMLPVSAHTFMLGVGVIEIDSRG
jgi:hypothetical protein